MIFIKSFYIILLNLYFIKFIFAKIYNNWNWWVVFGWLSVFFWDEKGKEKRSVL